LRTFWRSSEASGRCFGGAVPRRRWGAARRDGAALPRFARPPEVMRLQRCPQPLALLGVHSRLDTFPPSLAVLFDSRIVSGPLTLLVDPAFGRAAPGDGPADGAPHQVHTRSHVGRRKGGGLLLVSCDGPPSSWPSPAKGGGRRESGRASYPVG